MKKGTPSYGQNGTPGAVMGAGSRRP